MIKGINTLCSYGFNKKGSEVSREALRCVANALLLDEPTRQTFVDLDNGPKAAEMLKVRGSSGR
jgi:hypothetical protein